jgi:dihydroorotate dehydrogenase (fumarate)
VIKYLLAGADVVMTASALLRHGPAYAGVLLDGLSTWMTRKGYTSPTQLRGLLAVPADTHEADFERAGYVTALQRGQQTYNYW